MPKNEDIIKEIYAEAGAKGFDAPATDGKSNAELAAMLKEVKAAPPAPPAPVDTTDDDEKAPPYCVAEGHAITTMRGILADGDAISANDFVSGGADAIKAFVKSGHVVKN